MSFDKIFDLITGVYFYFYNISFGGGGVVGGVESTAPEWAVAVDVA